MPRVRSDVVPGYILPIVPDGGALVDLAPHGHDLSCLGRLVAHLPLPFSLFGALLDRGTSLLAVGHPAVLLDPLLRDVGDVDESPIDDPNLRDAAILPGALPRWQSVAMLGICRIITSHLCSTVSRSVSGSQQPMIVWVGCHALLPLSDFAFCTVVPPIADLGATDLQPSELLSMSARPCSSLATSFLVPESA